MRLASRSRPGASRRNNPPARWRKSPSCKPDRVHFPRWERLEDRLCPSTNYVVVAQTGDTPVPADGSGPGEPLTQVSSASVNDSAAVAFLGVSDSGFGLVDEATSGADGSVNLSALSYGNRDSGSPQIDDSGDVIATDSVTTESVSQPFLLDSYIRTWRPDGTDGSGPLAHGSADSVTLSAGSDVVLQPTISPDGTQFAYEDVTWNELDLYIDGHQVPGFSALSGGAALTVSTPGLPAVIANDGAVVVNYQNAIEVFQLGQSPVTIAGAVHGIFRPEYQPGDQCRRPDRRVFRRPDRRRGRRTERGATRVCAARARARCVRQHRKSVGRTDPRPGRRRGGLRE